MAGGLKLGLCGDCDTRLTQRDGVVICPECQKTMNDDAKSRIVVATPKMSEDELVGAICQCLIQTGSVVRHEKETFFVSRGELVTLRDATAMMMARIKVLDQRRDPDTGEVRTARPRLLKDREVALVKGRLQDRSDITVPRADIVAPSPILWRNAEDGLSVSRRGLHGAVFQAGRDVVPRDTGRWTELLDMTSWASEQDRRVYEAVAMTAVLPLEIDLYPLVIVFANIQSAGKTWLAKILAWTLGYPSTAKLPVVDGGGIGRGLGRAIVGGAKFSRCLILDNLTGSDNAIIQDNELSEALTSETQQAKALYRNGTEATRGRPIFWATLNHGVFAEDLASRGVSIELRKPDEPDERERRQAEVGELFWRRPDVAEEVLAELLWRTQRRWEETRGWTCPGTVRRPQTWHKLAWRLTGAEVPEVSSKIRMFGGIAREWLQEKLRDGLPVGELAKALQDSGLAGRDGRKLARLGAAGPAAVGQALAALAKEGWPLAKHRTKRGRVWTWTG